MATSLSSPSNKRKHGDVLSPPPAQLDNNTVNLASAVDNIAATATITTQHLQPPYPPQHEPPRPKKKKYKYIYTCSIEGCTNQVRQDKLCCKHGAKSSIKKSCTQPDCTNQAVKNGVCKRHGASLPWKACNIPTCTKQAVQGGVCIGHGAKQASKKLCKEEGCTRQAKKGGVCKKHGNDRVLCNTPGCTNQVRQKGLCRKHGAPAQQRKICVYEDCTYQARKNGLCRKHADAIIDVDVVGGGVQVAEGVGQQQQQQQQAEAQQEVCPVLAEVVEAEVDEGNHVAASLSSAAGDGLYLA